MRKRWPTSQAHERGKYGHSLPLAFRIARLFDRSLEDIFEPETEPCELPRSQRSFA